MRAQFSILVIALLVLGALSQQSYEKDPYSYFDIRHYVIKHQDISWDIDLEAQTVKASINYTFETLLYDSVIKLDIWNLDYVDNSAQITFNSKTTNVTIASIKNNASVLGDAYLDIGLGIHQPAKGEIFYVYLEYNITNQSKSLTWFTQQGLDGQPYQGIFTQSKAIYARGLFPTQDTPQVRFTWQARVNLKLNKQTLLMPGELISRTFDGVTNKTEFIFKQTQEVPAHGFGMWLDNYEKQTLSLSVQAYVNTKETTIRYLTDYFSDTEAYITQLEEYLGQPLKTQNEFKLQIVIGPHFSPLGGDTYPGIVVLSNDILPYDIKNSLGKSVLINSIARMWFGYQVVPKLWNCQFLSYGISTYLERLIIKNFYSVDDDDHIYRERSTLGNDSLYLFVQRTGSDSPKTALVPEIEDLEDPIELVNIAIYEKGYQMFSYIDDSIGPDLVQTFLTQWLKNNTGKFADEEDFKQSLHGFINETFRTASIGIWAQLNITYWYTHTGMVGGLFNKALLYYFKPKSQDLIEAKAFQFLHLGGYALPFGWQSIKQLGINEQIIFLNYFLARIETLNEDPDTERMLRVLDIKYEFSKSKEQQILVAWITLGLQTDYDEDVIKLAEQVLQVATAQSIVIPIYEALIFSDKQSVAQYLYDKHSHLYHNLVSSHIERLLREDDEKLDKQYPDVESYEDGKDRN